MKGNHAPASVVTRPPAIVTGEQIRRIRHALGWSQVDLARAMHVRFETVARWERGVYRPSPLAVATLRRVLLVPEVAEKLTAELQRIAAESTGK